MKPLHRITSKVKKFLVQPIRVKTFLIALGVEVAFLMGCAKIQPGADPIVVRTERTLQSAQATFQFALQVDNQDRGFWRMKAPAFHEFCNTLRVPTPYPLDSTNLYPQYRVWLLSLNDLKNDYKAGRASSNHLFVGLNVLSGSLNQAGAWLTIVSNRNATLNP